MKEAMIPKIECACGCGAKFRPRTGWHIFKSRKCKNDFNREMARLGKQYAEKKS